MPAFLIIYKSWAAVKLKQGHDTTISMIASKIKEWQPLREILKHPCPK
jgi:hypothetical protein